MKKSVCKKVLGTGLILAMVLQCLCGIVFADGTVLTGDGTASNPYQIGTFDDLLAFRAKVNTDGETGACAILTADIELQPSNADWGTIGFTLASGDEIAEADIKYTGTFDGNNHKLTNFAVSGNYKGLFGYTDGATIKNLTIEGIETRENGEGAVHGGNNGAFVGTAVGTTIQNCKFVGDVTGYADVKGILGSTDAASTNRNTVTECAFIGDVSAIAGVSYGIASIYTDVNKTYRIGNVTSAGESPACGFVRSGSAIENCYMIGDLICGDKGSDGEPSFFGVSAAVKNSFAYGEIKSAAWVCPISNSNNTTNNYWPGKYTAPSGSWGKGTKLTEADFASGKVAVLLNEGQATPVFGQTIGEDLYPVFLTSTNAVTKTAIGTYTNGTGENGTTVPYTISNYGNLAAFRDYVNGTKGKKTTNVKLTADITIPAGTKWTPIGTWTWDTTILNTTADSIYGGTFDGNGHKISGVVIDGLNPSRYSAFFKQTDGATIKNLTIEGNVGSVNDSDEYSVEAYAGGFVGVANGTTIDGCKFVGNVYSNNTAGGFIGIANNNSITEFNNITNCAFEGNVVANQGPAFGYTRDHFNIKNSYVVGNVEGQGDEVSGIGAFALAENCFVYGTVKSNSWAIPISNKEGTKNCYWLNANAPSGTYGKCNENRMTDDDFQSGAVTYMLNNNAGEIIFGQNLTEGTKPLDRHPVFYNNNMVYKNGTQYSNEGSIAFIGAEGVNVLTVQDAYVMIAGYTKDGDIETLVSMIPYSLSANTEYKVALPTGDGANVYRVFVWDGETTIKPLCAYAEYAVQ